MRYKHRFIKQVITTGFIIYFFCLKLTAQEPVTEVTTAREFSFFPEARISVAPSFAKHDESYISLSRYVSIDALRYGPFAFSLSTYEIFDYGTEDEKHKLKSIYYYMEYLNIRSGTSYGEISVFIDHRCMNYVDLYDPPPRLRWYGYGAGWQSRGMMIGEKNTGHGLSILTSDDYINFSASVRKPFYTEFYPYDYITDFTLRYDYYLTTAIIPYISGKSEIFISDKIKWNKAGELGIRFSNGSADIIPYAEFACITDRDFAVSGKNNTFSAGVKIEAALTEENSDAAAIPVTCLGISLSPDFHIQGSYSKYIDDKKKNYRSDILAALNLIQIKKISLFWNSSFIHSSPRENSGLYPRYIDYYNEAEITIPILNFFRIEPLYRHCGYGEGNTIDAGGFTYHLAGLRVKTDGMSPGYMNGRINGIISDSPVLLLNTEASIFAGWSPDNQKDENIRIIEGTLREDFFSYKTAVPYISLNVKFDKGNIPGREKINHEVTHELGIRLNRQLVFMIFYQYIRNSSTAEDYDISRSYHTAGVRIDL